MVRWCRQPPVRKHRPRRGPRRTRQQLLTRHGIVTRETTASEASSGGFSGVYQVLKAMEDAGRVRRGYFVAGLGGAQFALPARSISCVDAREPPKNRARDHGGDRSRQSIWIDDQVAGT